jgi:hypothetical protein
MFRKYTLTAILLLLGTQVFSQKSKKDTIYYLLDTTKTPANDQMWKIGIEGPFKYFKYQCACLDFKSSPAFIHNTAERGRQIKAISDKLWTLPLLIKALTDDGGRTFNNKHIVFFIEPVFNEYIEHHVRLLAPTRQEPAIDFEIIKNDTSQAVKNK